MASPYKDESNRLIGIWRHPTGGWEICFYKDGKKQSEYRRNETIARQRGAYWKAILSGDAPPAEIGDEAPEHPVLFWEGRLRWAADYIMQHPDDDAALDLGKVMASMATAGFRAAAFHPPPPAQHNPDGAPVGEADLLKLKTEDLMKLIDAKGK